MARQLVGTVVSDKGDKTIVVSVTARKTHPIYKKQYSVSKKFMAHDENNEAHPGDRVRLVETRPLSARKRFTLEKVLENARITHVEPEATAPKPKAAKAEAVEAEAQNTSEGEA